MSSIAEQSANSETVVLTSGMTDEELIRYCETHCQTERALFSAAQINRMLELSDYMRFNGPVQPDTCWISLHSEMMEMCEQARLRMEAADTPA